MSIQRIGETELAYHLVCFDKDGRERSNGDATTELDAIVERLKDRTRPVSDILIACHGWLGDVPAAEQQYAAWFSAAFRAMGDIDDVRRAEPDFVPLIVGLHWPSLPWGIEEISACDAESGTLAAGAVEDSGALAQIAASVSDTEVARAAIKTIIEAAKVARSTTLTPQMLDAYMTLFDESALCAEGLNGRPGFDLDRFDPQELIDAQGDEAGAAENGDEQLLGVTDTVKNALLAPLRMLSFWKMKDRARQIGETGARNVLVKLQTASPGARFHLMGHSFGCIVVSAMTAGPRNGNVGSVRPVDSLYLAQGALSLWSYANNVPYETAAKGYFNRIVEHGLVRGPIIATRSRHDHAVGRFYPLGARVRTQTLLGEVFPEYGGIGAFGIQGVESATPVIDMKMRPGVMHFDVNQRGIYNVDATDVISNGSGPSGAHSDIAHPEVAHSFWAGVTCGIDIARRQRPIEAKEQRLLTEAVRRAERLRLSRGPSTRFDPFASDAAPSEGLLSVDDAVSDSAATDSNSSRWINAIFEGVDRRQSLQKGEWYPLTFDVDIEPRAGSLVATKVSDNALVSGTAEYVTLTVWLDSADFDLSHAVSSIRVPREGRGRNRARFDVSPRVNGRASLKATILRDGNYVQQIDMTFDVGADNPSEPEVVAQGRSLSNAQVLEPRDVGLRIEPTSDGYECTVWGPVYSSTRITVSHDHLQYVIDRARKALLAIVKTNVNGNYVFQSGMDIPDNVSKDALRLLAEAGADLMYVLFEGPEASEDSKGIAAFLRKLSGMGDTRLKIQIIAAKLPVPWTMLYLGGVGEHDRIDWNAFLGMRHIVEQIPLQRSLNVWEHGIVSNKPKLMVGLHLNEDIDRKMKGGFVQSQRAFWSGMPIGVTTRLNRAEVLSAFNDATTADQIIYFYCHAISRGLTEEGGPDASYLLLGEESKLTLADLRRNASASCSLAGNPLVFINACESAEMSSTFYDGFVPYFMSKGARGVIGTECLTPAYFATEWARRFFVRFLGGQRLGEACLDLRRELMERHRNPLGLLYAVHCDADTRVVPPMGPVAG